VPREWQVDDEHADSCLAEVPVHVNVGDEGRHKAIHLGQNVSDDDEDTQAEDAEKNELLTQRQADSNQQWHGDKHNGNIAGDGEGAVGDFIVLVRRALI
jgi:hypothetical protein